MAKTQKSRMVSVNIRMPEEMVKRLDRISKLLFQKRTSYVVGYISQKILEDEKKYLPQGK